MLNDIIDRILALSDEQAEELLKNFLSQKSEEAYQDVLDLPQT